MSDHYTELLLDGPGRSLSGQSLSLSLSLPYTHLEDTYIKMISMYELNILPHLITFQCPMTTSRSFSLLSTPPRFYHRRCRTEPKTGCIWAWNEVAHADLDVIPERVERPAQSLPGRTPGVVSGGYAGSLCLSGSVRPRRSTTVLSILNVTLAPF